MKPYSISHIYFKKEVLLTNSKNLSLRNQSLSAEILNLQNQLDLLPDGKLICIPNGGYVKWYQFLNGQYTYISKKKRPLAEKLAIRAYLSCRMEDLKDEQNAINAYFSHYDAEHLHTHELLSQQFYLELLSNYFNPLSPELDAWCKAPYEHCTNHPENLIHKSVSGNILRSKSEAMIDMLLFQAKIPYRYECQLNLNGSILYPDFTIRHPRTGETYYWEHFGMMDNPFYARSYLKKMQQYLENGIIPEINLISTFESRDNPLTSEKVQRLIDDYFA